MSEDDNWLDRFRRSHDRLSNPVVYWLALPLLVIGAVGILWSLPVPAQFYDISPLLNWGSAFLMATAIYYFIISLSLAIGLLPLLLLLAAIELWIAATAASPLAICAGLSAAGVAGLTMGRSGKIPSVIEDIQLMMIAPAWVLSLVYQRFKIPI